MRSIKFLLSGFVLFNMTAGSGWAQAVANTPFQKGETITFEIKKLGLKAGQASLVYRGPAEINGQKALQIIFSAEALNFQDVEKIFLDPETFYPLVVRRTLNLWGKKEVIEERYDQKKGVVSIIKRAGGKETRQVIKKGHRIDNIYCFIYRYRNSGKFVVGEKLDLYLPTKDIQITLLEKTEIKAADRNFDAYYMESDPKQYRVWFDSGKQKIPLRIDGAVGFGKTLMVMQSYSKE